MQHPLRLLWFFVAVHHVVSQNISTSMQIPPLQWLNLGAVPYLGSAPVPLRDAHMSYDPSKRVLIIFGGESSAGVPTQQTYVLQLDDLTWRTPVPPAAQQDIPPARSAGVFGQDLASNYRSGMLVYGGKGGNGNTPLNDLWYYSFQNEFWANINITTTDNPLGRWGAAGGTAPASAIQNVETFMWLAGGTNNTGTFTFEDVWQLDMTGAIAAGSVVASGAWSRVPTSASDSSMTRYGLAGTVIPPVDNTDREGTLVIFGGCDPDPSGEYNATCAQNAGSILTLPTSSEQTNAQWTTAADCPPGSFGATLAPNRNQAASIFESQAFLFPGAVDKDAWNDTSGTQPGEVGILLANSGVWARVLPAGDPNSNPSRPSPKEGAAVYSHSAPITGEAGAWSDTIVFGGYDAATGELTNELWILRAYNGSITASGQQWSGYGNGQLQTGLNASGSGVTVEYLPTCATPIQSSSKGTSGSPTTSGTPSSSTSTGTQNASVQTIPLLAGAPVHKIISPASIALVVPAMLLYRASSGPLLNTFSSSASVVMTGVAALVGVIAYALGIAGFALGVSHKTWVASPGGSVQRRDVTSSSEVPFLSTSYSKAALVLFIILYGFLPLVAAILFVTTPGGPRVSLPKSKPRSKPKPSPTEEKQSQLTIPTTAVSVGPSEKGSARGSEDDGLMDPGRSTARISVESHAIASEDGEDFPSRRRTKSQSSGGLWAALGASTSKSRRRSDTTLQTAASPPPSSYNPSKFEVVNRPKRTSHHQNSNSPSQSMQRNPSDLSWMERRRSVNMFGQLDYEMSQVPKTPPFTVTPAAPSSAHEMSPTTPPIPALTPPRLPRTAQLWFNVGLQVVILWALVFWIVTFALLPSTPGLAVMAIVTVAYFIANLALAWKKRPQQSILVVLINRLRGDPADAMIAAAPSGTEGVAPPSRPPSSYHPVHSSHRPYMHSPPWRLSRPHADDDVTSRGARSMESDPPDDDENDEERQARIEEEMARRDVSIFTVPKRRLVVRN